MHHPTDRIVYTTVFVTPVLEHQLEQDGVPDVYHEGSTHHTMTEHSTTALQLTPPSGCGDRQVSSPQHGSSLNWQQNLLFYIAKQFRVKYLPGPLQT